MYDNPLPNRKYKHICDVCVEKCSQKNGVITRNSKKKWKIKESDDYIKSVNRYFRELAVYFSWIYLSKTSVQNISVV